ncbi:hypothetical protein LTR08_001272 [Meristemomyces frigidus]|nr:hypothetical protein LTR08_001272 [Meristemomyces frigidus]
MQTLKDLAKQTEALHARYASLRSDRQKLSTSIVCGIREQKAGPEYCNTLLDQHLCLAAINSSMDICFAKLKSLECRKEEAMTSILTHNNREVKRGRTRQLISVNQTNSLQSAQPGRSTSELMIEVVNPRRAASKLRKDSARSEDPEQHEPSARDARRSSLESIELVKHNTMIRTTPATINRDSADHDSTEAEDDRPKKLRINGAKAAGILGLTQDADSRPNAPDITLPNDGVEVMLMPAADSAYAGEAPSLTVHIPPRSPLMVLPPQISPAPTRPLPTPPAQHHFVEELALMATTTRQPVSCSVEAVSVVLAVSPVESSPEEPAEVQTPLEGDDEETSMGLKSAQGEPLQTLQVFVDEGDVLDAYHYTGRT